MTPEQIDSLEAGRELDALIAEKVMGWKWLIMPHGDISRPGQYTYTRNLVAPHRVANYDTLWNGTDDVPNAGDTGYPCYSSEIADAWEVIEKLRALDKLSAFSQACDFDTPWAWLDYPTADMCLLICRAALKALTVEQDKARL